jgi:hypothetical protein
MSTKDIKELAEMATAQYRDKIIGFIKEYGTISTHIKTYRLFDNDNNVPSYESCVIVKIENGNVYYDDNVCDDLDALSMDELYNIIIKL